MKEVLHLQLLVFLTKPPNIAHSSSPQYEKSLSNSGIQKLQNNLWIQCC